MIYVIEEEGHDYAVKIGFTDRNEDVRAAELQTGNPRRLRVVRILEGDEAEEHRLHEVFAEERLSGEWFRLSDRVRQFAHEGITPENKKIEIAREHRFGDTSINVVSSETVELSRVNNFGDVSISRSPIPDKITVMNGVHRK